MKNANIKSDMVPSLFLNRYLYVSPGVPVLMLPPDVPMLPNLVRNDKFPRFVKDQPLPKLIRLLN